MIKTTTDAGVAVTVGPWQMVIVESTRCAVVSLDGGLAATAMREPIAIVVRHPDGDRAFVLEQRESAPPERQ